MCGNCLEGFLEVFEACFRGYPCDAQMVCWDESEGQVSTIGQVRTHQVKTGQTRTGQVRTGHLRTGPNRTEQLRTGQVRTGQFRTGQVRTELGQVKSCSDRPNQVQTGQV